MNMMRVGVAVLGSMAFLVPACGMGQLDPNGNPQNPANMNAPGSQPGNPQGMQPGTPTQQSGQPNQPSSMRDSLGAPGQTGRQMEDKQFMRGATEGGIAEVKLGSLAAQKGGPEVKEFGQKMVEDHTAMNKDMATVADGLGVMLPKKMNKEDQAEYDKLNGLSGDSFDKEYILYMVVDHRKDLHDFRMEASVAADPALEAEVTKGAAIIRQHLMMITKLATDKGVTLPPRPPRPAAPASK